MIEHAVPQNVTSYQFHLIGNMTIKQFLMILAGVGVGGLIYSTNLAAILKWPLILVFVGAGAALAFVPFEERSLDQWLINFIRAMYRPTKFFWRRMGKPPELFAFTPRTDTGTVSAQPALSRSVRQNRVNSYLSTLSTNKVNTQEVDPLDMLGQSMSDLDSLFASTPAAKNIMPGADQAVKPHLQVRARPLKDQTATPTTSTATAVYVAPAAPPVMTTELPEPEVSASASTLQPGQLGAAVAELPNIVVEAPNDILSATLPVLSDTPQPAVPVLTAETPPALPEVVENTMTAVTGTANSTPVVFNRSLPFPSLPDQANMLLGMVYDTAGNILPNAILEILNNDGNTVRALKTNPLGQFYSSTPLAAGQYRIEIEHEGHTFPTFSLNVDDSILDPIEIRSSA